jgi:hypothetical protein
MRDRDRADMMCDYQWPHLVLPMKRYIESGVARVGGLQTAVLLNPVKEGERVTLFEGNMFSGIDPATATKIEYDSVDDCLDAGWKVD